MEEGIAGILIDTGAVIGPSICGPCPGGSLGALTADKAAISTSNRNFVGRMGHPTSRLLKCSYREKNSETCIVGMGLLVRLSFRLGFYDPLFHTQKCIPHDGKFSVLDHMDCGRHCEYVCYLS